MAEVPVRRGFADAARPEIARLFWAAFRGKLGAVMGPEAQALRFLERAADPAHALCATAEDGAVLGVAGFKTAAGGFIGGGLSDLAGVYGWFGALWRGALLAALERKPPVDLLQMDGIFVAEAARGRGVGAALLDAVAQEARQRGLAGVTLDVIDVNPRARALYERRGFRAVATQRTGPLRHVFGFASATRMELRFADEVVG
ncbi:MAG: GNAT family N-acetyltransferase [Pseudomonadota bacterium]